MRLFNFGLQLSLSRLLAAATFATAADQPDLDAALTLFKTRGKSAEAHAAFEALAAADPQNHPAQLHLGLLALRRDDTEKAIVHLERAVALAPNDGASHKALGDAYGRSAQKASLFKQLGFAKKCLAAYERAVALAPDRVEFRQSLFEYYFRAPALAGGGRDKALAEAAAIKKLDPNAGRVALSRIHVEDKKFDAAFAEFEEPLKSNPDDFTALFQIGRLSALTGHTVDRGIAALRRCLELTPPSGPNQPTHVQVHWRLGQLHEKKNDPAAARAAYEAALQLDPAFTAAKQALDKLK